MLNGGPLTIPMPVTPSLNKITKKHWAAYYRYKKEFLASLVNYELLGLRTKRKMRVTVQRFSARLLDKDNYIGGTKPLMDAIKEKGLIVDDSPRWVEVEYLPQVKCEKWQQKTVVTIAEIESTGPVIPQPGLVL